MRRIALATLVVASLFSALSPTVAKPRRPQQPPSYDFSRIDELLQQSLPTIGGGCALLMIKDGRVVYRKAFGSFTTETIEPIASSSKWLSAGVIMSLVDDGLISLDDPIARYIPEFSGGQKPDVTIREAFSHTSGMVSDATCPFDQTTTLEECADSIVRLPLRSAPGAEFRYGNASMHVTGRVAEIVTGESWDEAFAERVSGPLGMSHTDYEGLGETDNPLIAGGAESTIDDYGAYLEMLLNRGRRGDTRVLSESAVDTMLRDQTNGAEIVGSPYIKYGDLDPTFPTLRYGIGNWLERVDATTGEVTENSSQGAFGCSPWIDRRRNLAGVLLVYSTGENVQPVYVQLKSLVREIVPEDAYTPTVESVALSKKKVKRSVDPDVTITWKTSEDSGAVEHDLLFAADGQNFTTTVAEGLPGDASSFTWTVPADVPKTKHGVVKVVAKNSAGRTGESVSATLVVK